MELRFNSKVTIPVNKVMLPGVLYIPQEAGSIVVFAHGSGSSRLSPRNKMVADFLHQKKIGTLLFDLLTVTEDAYCDNRFNIDLLTRRLIGATEWLATVPEARRCTIGYFGASTGSAAALKASVYLPKISAVVSRGGRPDLVMDELSKVDAPVLLIVGSLDYDVLEMNREAYIQLGGEKKLAVIQGATHLFEEQGMMEQVCCQAEAWFSKYLKTGLLLR